MSKPIVNFLLFTLSFLSLFGIYSFIFSIFWGYIFLGISFYGLLRMIRILGFLNKTGVKVNE